MLKNLLKKKKLKVFIKIFQKKTSTWKKYSNKLMLSNALDQFIEKKFDYLVFSTADILVPNNLFYELQKINIKNFVVLYIRTHKL